MRHTRLAPLLLLPVLAACSSNTNDVRTFALLRDAPDESRVTTRAPLSMPPDTPWRQQPGRPELA